MIDSYRISSTSDVVLPPWSLVLIAMVTGISAMLYPFHLALCLVLTGTFVAFCVKPMVAVYVTIASFSFQSCTIELHYENASYFHSYIWIYLFQILNLINMAAVVTRSLIDYHTYQGTAGYFNHRTYRWIFFLFGTFIVWTFFSAMLSSHFYEGVLGWWKLNCNFALIALLMINLDRFEKYIKVMAVYCGAAVVFALGAIYATNHAFLTNKVLYVTPSLSVSAQLALFNRPGGYLPHLDGLVNGFGLCGKHDLAIFMVSAIFFGAFLFKNSESWRTKALLAAVLCLCETILYNNFMKLALASSLFFVVFFSIAVPSFRRHFVRILALFVCLNIMGWAGSRLIISPHQKETDEVLSSVITKLSTGSRFERGSLKERAGIWEKTAKKAFENPFVGIGPGGLREAFFFNVPHGHNLFLTLAAEYGVASSVIILSALLLIATCAYYNLFSRYRTRGRSWLLQLTFLAATGCTLFEYCFDCEVWSPHLWVILGLLLASMNMKQTVKRVPNGRDVEHGTSFGMNYA